MTKRHLLKIIKNLFLAVLVLQVGVSYANWPTNPTDLEDGHTYYITSKNSGTVVFHVDGGTTDHTYLKNITIDGGKNVTIVFNTSHRLWLNGVIKVINGTLTLKLGNDYSVPNNSHTIARYPGQGSIPAYTDFLLQTDNSSDDVNDCKLIIKGNSSYQFIISGDGTFTLDANDNNDVGYYNLPTMSGIVASYALAHFNGGTVDFDYVTLQKNINYDTSNSGLGGAVYAHMGSSSQSINVITMDHCVIEKCLARGRGGAINYYDGRKINGQASSIKMTDCVVRDCYTTSEGSGGTIRTIGVSCCSLEMTRCQIYSNKSAAGFGAIGFYSVNVEKGIKLDGCEIYDNWGHAGTVCITTNGTITGCTIRDNYSQQNGGGLYCYSSGTSDNRPNWTERNGTLTLDAATVIERNHAKGNGGGIYFLVQPIQITGGTAWTLYCNNEGKQYKKELIIQGTKINNNTAGGNGGGIYIERSTDVYVSNLQCHYGELDGNTAGGRGGAFYVKSTLDGNSGLLNDNQGHSFSWYETNVNPPFSRTNFDVDFGGHSSEGHYLYVRGNSAVTGGAGYIYGKKLVVDVMNGAVIGESGKGNTATAGNGGAIYFDGILEGSTYGTFNFIGGSMNYNSAVGGSGGGLYLNNGTVVLSGSDIQNNTATVSGGGIYVSSNANVSVDAGAFDVQHNTVNGVPNNLYLPTNKTIEVISGSFNPEYLGIYTQETATSAKRTKFPVFTVSNAADSLYLRTIYNGMKNGTMNVIDDRQIHSAEYSHAVPDILYFGIGSPWSPLQQTVRKATDLVDSNGDGVYEIGNIKQLTAFLWYANGITTHDATFTPAVPGAQGILTADIDMENHYWKPFADYAGTFDGNGHIITGITMVPTNESTGRGLFGTTAAGADIKNVTLDNCQFFAPSSGTCYVGSIVSDLSAGKVSNSVANPGTQLFASGNASAILGGLAGKVSGGTLHSSIAMTEMMGYTMGGLVGQVTSGGNLYNSFANPKFTVSGGTPNVGGLVAENTGQIENCYVRLERAQSLGSAHFGMLAATNSGTNTIVKCYAPDGDASQFSHSYTYLYNNETTGLAHCDLYKKVDAPYLYTRPNDNLVGTGSTMTDLLNSWVDDHSGYAKWNRSTAGGYSYTYDDGRADITVTGGNINDDYPLPKMQGLCCAASPDGIHIEYKKSLDDMIDKYNGLSGGGTIWLYGSPKEDDGSDELVSETNDDDVLLYIDEDASLLQSGTTNNTLTAYTSQTLKTYTAERWHDFSTSLKESKIGISYTDNGKVDFSWASDPCGVKFSADNDNALFPSDIAVASMDLYSFYEPEYHWINFRRNSLSHWHENAQDVQIIYLGNGIQPGSPYQSTYPEDPSDGNEPHLVPGKGYLVSVDKEQLLQNKGVLNNGDVTLYSVTKTDFNAWAERLGFNLLGNPYQSYLDFEKFIKDDAGTDNGSNLWEGTNEYNRTFAVFDPELNAYRQYKKNSSYDSYGTSQYIHPHQGFFIRMTKGDASANSTTVKYTNAMRTNDANTAFRGDNHMAYPLVNFIVRDSEGNGDVAVLELGRTNEEGALKMRLGECTGRISLGYEGDDYGILFRNEVEDYQSLRFEATEAGTFTLTWNTANAEFDKLTLIDNIAGTTTDMLGRNSYSFEATPDQYPSRFKVVIGDYKGIDDPEEDGLSTGSRTFAFQMGDQLVVNGEGDLQIVDMLGRVVMTEQLTGSQSTTSLPKTAGVYLLRLTGSNGTQTQKIVIR